MLLLNNALESNADSTMWFISGENFNKKKINNRRFADPNHYPNRHYPNPITNCDR